MILVYYLILGPNIPIPKYSKNNYEFYIGSSVKITPTFNSSIDYCTLSEELNIPGVKFDYSTGSFTGVVNSFVNSSEYTVTCVNGIGISSVNLSFIILNNTIEEGCEYEGKSLIKIIIKTITKPSRIIFYIDNPDGSNLLTLSGSSENWENNKQYVYTQCIEPGIYTSRRESTSNAGWNYQTIAILLYSTVISNYTIRSIDPSTITNQLFCIFIFI